MDEDLLPTLKPPNIIRFSQVPTIPVKISKKPISKWYWLILLLIILVIGIITLFFINRKHEQIDGLITSINFVVPIEPDIKINEPIKNNQPDESIEIISPIINHINIKPKINVKKTIKPEIKQDIKDKDYGI